jgi:copper chaperone CopZ
VDTVQLSVPSLVDERTALDLSNSLNSLAGVARIETDVRAHTVTVTYDPDLAGPDLFRHATEGTGYPLRKDGA